MVINYELWQKGQHMTSTLVRLVHQCLDHLDSGELLDLVDFGMDHLDLGWLMDYRSINILLQWCTNDEGRKQVYDIYFALTFIRVTSQYSFNQQHYLPTLKIPILNNVRVTKKITCYISMLLLEFVALTCAIVFKSLLNTCWATAAMRRTFSAQMHQIFIFVFI